MKPFGQIYTCRLLLLFLLTSVSVTFGEILHLKIPSAALSDSNRVIVATPTNYDENTKNTYPFIIMLHGWSGDETQWEDDSELQVLSDKYNVLLVLPDGGYDGWWVDTDLTPGRNYDTHIRQELKIWIINNFNGCGDPAHQGILGLSMGGYGSIMQALKYPGEYAAASSLSGIMDISRHPENWHMYAAFGPYTEDAVTWKLNNPIELLSLKKAKKTPPLQLICGRDDFAFPENQDMATKLNQLGYTVDFREEAGTHSHTFWKTHVETAVAFLVSNFSGL